MFMKLFFLKDQSLYKIFKTLEKIPNNKTIHIYIDPEHAFFDNEWRGKQIQEILTDKNLNAFFITKTDKARNFFRKIWLEIIHQEKHPILKYINLAYLFFFNIKTFHLQAYTKKNYMFYAIFGFEIWFILLILFLLYSLILPSTIVDLKSSNQIENITYNFRYYPSQDTEYPKYSRFLSIPFLTGFIDYKYDMTLSVSNIKHIQNPSRWEIFIKNQTDEEYSLIKWTRFETPEWLIFKADNYFKIPAAKDGEDWEVVISVTADEQDAQWFVIWARWNITKWTKLYIKNIKSSYFFKEIYAQAMAPFTWWLTQSQWSISSKDIWILSGKLLDYIYKQKMNIVSQNFNLENSLLLNFDPLIRTEIKQVQILNKPGENVPLIKWTIIVRLNFMYIKRDDLLSSIDIYLAQRPSQKVKLINIDQNSIVFFNDIKEDKWVYILPTKVSVIQWYDFTQDINWVLDSIKSRILWATKEETQDIILSYPEISSVKIKIRPPRYNTVPKLKSRIKMQRSQ